MRNSFTPFIITFIFSLFIATNLMSQIKNMPKAVTTAHAEKGNKDEILSYFKLDASYLTNSVYLGRKDSLTLPYITPALSYYHKSGLYASVYVGFLNSKETKQVDYYSFDLGYEFKITDNMTANVYGDKTFNNDSSNRVNGDINGRLNANLTYDFNVVELSSEFNTYFSAKTDFAFFSSINHAFYLGKEDRQWTINPTALVNFSTLNFYEGYTSGKVGRKQLLNPNIVSVTATTTVENNKMTLMNYELSLPISFETKRFGFYITPTYSIPHNAINTKTVIVATRKNGTKSINTVNSTPYSERYLEKTFYGEIGFNVKF